MPEFIVELLVFVEADSHTDAEALGERSAKNAANVITPRSAGRAKIVSVIVSDVREASA